MRFDYLKPKNLQETLEILSQADEEIRVLAGGTDILVNIQEGIESPRTLVDLSALRELKKIEEKNGRIEIGALVTHAQVANSAFLQEKARLLTQACGEIGSPQIRSQGTLGGNLVNASPAADAIPPLYVLGAVLTLKSRKEERELPIEAFFTGVKKTVIRPDELIVKIAFPVPERTQKGFFKKLGQRKALAVAKVSLAALLDLEGKKIKSARLALGAVATTVIRAPRTESFLDGKKLKKEVITRAALIVAEESKAIADIRSTAQYRNEMTGVLLARGLEEIMEQG